MTNFYFSKCGKYRLCAIHQSGISGGTWVNHVSYFSKDQNNKVKHLTRTEFEALKGSQPVDLNAHF